MIRLMLGSEGMSVDVDLRIARIPSIVCANLHLATKDNQNLLPTHPDLWKRFWNPDAEFEFSMWFDGQTQIRLRRA